MEHRFGMRHPLCGRLTLRPPGAGPVAAQLREASISGMFVSTPPEMFSCNTVVDVEMTVPGATGLRCYHWQAMVIRKTAEGLGLMFDRVRPPAISRLLAGAAALDTGRGPGGLPPATVVPLRRPAPKSPGP